MLNTKLVMWSGDTQPFDLAVTTDGGIVPDITTWTFTLKVRARSRVTAPIVFEVDTFTILDGPGGKVRITVADGVTTALNLTKDTLFYYWLEEATPTVNLLAFGTLRINVDLSFDESYSTPEKLSRHLSPRMWTGLTGDGKTPNVATAQAALDRASSEINRKVTTRYVTPLPETSLQSRAMLESIEEPIAIWALYRKNGFDSTDAGAAAAKLEADVARADLDKIEKAALLLPDAPLRLRDEPTRGSLWGGEEPHFNPLDPGDLFDSSDVPQ